MAIIPKLALIPSGYKAGKLYSVLPTDGAGDFTTTRASVATRVNSNGLIEEVAANVPRLDYSDGGCPSLLLEPTTLNLVPYSENFSNSSWVGGGNITVESGYLAPDGSNNACKVSGSGGALNTSIGLLQSTTRSIYVRTVSGVGKISLLSYFGNSNNLFDITEEWQRFEISTSIGTGTNSFYAVDFRSLSATLSEVIIWGANATNDQSYATSYIKNEGTSAGITRSADTANGAGNSTVINSTEGVLYFEGIATNPDVSANSQISISSATNSGNNRVMITPSSDTLLILRFNAGGTQLVTQAVTVSSLSVNSKIAVRWGNGNYSLYQNGSEVYTQAIASTPTGLAKLNFSSVTETNNFNGKVKDVRVYTTALSNIEIEKLTSWTSFTAMANGQSYTII